MRVANVFENLSKKMDGDLSASVTSNELEELFGKWGFQGLNDEKPSRYSNFHIWLVLYNKGAG